MAGDRNEILARNKTSLMGYRRACNNIRIDCWNSRRPFTLGTHLLAVYLVDNGNRVRGHGLSLSVGIPLDYLSARDYELFDLCRRLFCEINQA